VREFAPMEGRVHRRAGDGRPWHEQFEGSREPVNELTDPELEAELTVAAYAPGRARLERYLRLLDERRRRLMPA
jgi:hypothetical protein